KELMHPRAPSYRPQFRISRLKPSVQNPQLRLYTRITAVGIEANGDAEIGIGGARSQKSLRLKASLTNREARSDHIPQGQSRFSQANPSRNIRAARGQSPKQVLSTIRMLVWVPSPKRQRR